MPGNVGAHSAHCSKTWRKTHSRWFFKIKTKTLQALQPQHQHRELWALTKRAWLNYPTAPGMSRPSPGVTAAPELSYKTLAASGGLAGIFLFSVPPSKQTQTQSQGCHAGFAPASLEARAGGCLNSCPFTLKHAEIDQKFWNSLETGSGKVTELFFQLLVSQFKFMLS